MSRTIILLLLATVANAETPPVLTARPVEDAAAVLHNPDMGWVLYENAPLDPDPAGSSTLLALPGEDFPEVDAVALMASWQDIERREGVYDFERLDAAYDHWRRRGKEIHLRISTESLLWWSRANPPAGLGVPGYVLDRLPAGAKQTRREEGGLPYAVVDAREPFYLDRLGRFLRAVAEHFRGDRAVALVDLRGFGLWGEWHSGFRYPTAEARREALIGILDAWSRAFPDRRLALSYSYDPDGPDALRAGPTDRDDPAATASYADFLRYSAFDHALDLPNVAWRRDGVGGAVHPNERRLNAEAFDRGRGPMMSEFLGGYASLKPAGRARVDRSVADALSLHPNYVALLGWQGKDALDFARERPDLIELGLRTMGYRLVPVAVRYPARFADGVPARVEVDWANRGVGRALRDFRLRLILADDAGRPLAALDAGPMPTSRWVRDRTYAEAAEATFRGIPPGRHRLRLALVDSEGNRPIALPLVGRGDDGSYPVGGVELGPAP